MNRWTVMTVGATAGGLLSAFSHSATAFADWPPSLPCDEGNYCDVPAAGDLVPPTELGSAAFNLGGFTWDPFHPSEDLSTMVDGFAPISNSSAQVEILPFFVASQPVEQQFNIFGTADGSALLGNVDTYERVADVLGMTNVAFTVGNVDPADGVLGSDLPASGSVYDVFDFGGGFANVYSAIPGADGADATFTDSLVTPFGDFDLSPLFGDGGVSGLFDPADAFLGL